jgi:threonine/homoserine/homoserine lactone efflux protein
VTRALLSFALVAGLLTIVPGLDTALVLRAAISQSRGAAFATALGIGSGSLVWGAGAAAGVSALLVASHLAYDALRLVGAVYLVVMGARLLWAALGHDSVGPALPVSAVRGGLWSAWRRGFVTNLLNPKVGAFYVAVLPQFLPAHLSGLGHLGFGVLLALVHDVEGMAWFSVLIYFATKLRGVLARRSVRRGVDATTGAVLIGFGAGLALDRR